MRRGEVGGITSSEKPAGGADQGVRPTIFYSFDKYARAGSGGDRQLQQEDHGAIADHDGERGAETMYLSELADGPRQNHATDERDGKQDSEDAAGICFEAAAGEAERNRI